MLHFDGFLFSVMAQPASVLVIGNAGVGKFSLVRALRASLDTKTKNGAYQLTLDTKYYTAEVLLHCVGPDYNPETAFEAVVLVFDVSEPSTFEAVRSWSDVHNVSSAEVKLVVANKMDKLQRAGKQLPQPWLDDAISWCCDNAYEFIEAAAGESSIDEQLHSDTEQGVARVLAALQAHMWPGLQRKGWTPDCHSDRSGSVAHDSSSCRSTHQDEDGVRRQEKTTAAATGGGHAGEVASQLGHCPAEATHISMPAALTSNGLPQPAEAQQQLDHSSCPPAVFCRSSSSSSHVQRPPLQQLQQEPFRHSCAPHHDQQQPEQKQQMQGYAADCDPVIGGSSAIPRLSLAAATAAAAAPAGRGGGADVIDDDYHPLPDGDLDDFDLMMTDMRGVRARLAALPDAERRAAAAELALQFAVMLGLDADDDESSCNGHG